MSSRQVEILFICGSPRAHDSEALLAFLERGAREAGARSRKFLLSKKHLAPCNGCGYCEKTGSCVLADEHSPRHINDDYLELMEALSYADALAVVSPLYFAGPPAQLKALFDRMQPFWSRQYLLKQERLVKRPAQVFILGGGGDKHGYDPLVTIAKSALAVAGFSMEKVQNFIGFREPQKVPHLPTEEEASGMSYVELSRLRKEVSLQREFEQRALAAGSAFARLVIKSRGKAAEELPSDQQDGEKAGQQAPQQTGQQPEKQGTIKAPGLASETEIPETDGGSLDHSSDAPITVVNMVDSDFEALKQAARATKSPKNQRRLDEAIEEAVAHLATHPGEDVDASSTTDGPRVEASSDSSS